MNLMSVAARSALALLLSGGAACAGAPRERPIEMGPVDQGQGSLVAARKYLEGRWTLESFEVFPAGGAPVALRGQGTLVYDNFGNLQVEIRTDEKTADLLRAAGIDIRENTISTSGRTAVDMQNRTLTYVLQGQPPATSPSSPLALSRPRYWEVDGDLLTLTTRDESGKPLSIGRWRRMP